MQGFHVNTCMKDRESVAGSVSQATGMVEFEDGLRTEVLPGGCWYPFGSSNLPRINSAPPKRAGKFRLVMGAVWLSKNDQCQTKLQFCWVPRKGDIKLQLLCGDRIALAVGSLPYPRLRTGKVWSTLCLPGRGAYQASIATWTWGKIPPSFRRHLTKPR